MLSMGKLCVLAQDGNMEKQQQDLDCEWSSYRLAEWANLFDIQ